MIAMKCGIRALVVTATAAREAVRGMRGDVTGMVGGEMSIWYTMAQPASTLVYTPRVGGNLVGRLCEGTGRAVLDFLRSGERL